jgi:hypothetical protein
MRPRKLTATQEAKILAVLAARDAMPTNQELADQHGVCKTIIDKLSMSVSRASMANTVVNATSLCDVRE